MIGGNISATLQVGTTTKNSIGERVKTWEPVLTLSGWLDLASGDSKRTVYSAKVQESTHVFICDYTAIPTSITVEGINVNVNAESCRMVANSQKYDVMLIDDPMELHQQLEIYLKYTGGNA